jgi:cytochrome c-type biogenesis protein CcmH
MLFWMMMAAMTGAAVLAVLWPLSRGHRVASSAREAALAVYRDQLAEIERDRRRGVLADTEAEAARIEVSRRLLAADAARDGAAAPGATGRRRTAALMSLAGIPLLALIIYGAVGSPQLQDARIDEKSGKGVELAAIVRSIEGALDKNPGDGRGWEVLVPYYLSVGRNEDALKAQQNALRLLGPTAEREATLGETLVAVANGVVTPEARAAFDRAVGLNASSPKALFFLGLAALQSEKREEARLNWQRVLQIGSPDDRWVTFARYQLDQLGDGK